MAKKIPAFIILFLFSLYFNGVLPYQEIFYDGQMQEITGKKIYNYDENKNLTEIDNLDSNSILQSKIVYSYKNNLLINSEDYNGRSPVKNSIFLYKNSRLIKKNEFDPSDRLILYNEYLYDTVGELTGIRFFSENGDYLGDKKFIYENNMLIEEKNSDKNDRITLTKKYIYKEKNISIIEFYSSSNEKIRIIERIYSNIEDNTNKFGFKENFWDLR
jgi:hypothetical protein